MVHIKIESTLDLNIKKEKDKKLLGFWPGDDEGKIGGGGIACSSAALQAPEKGSHNIIAVVGTDGFITTSWLSNLQFLPD